MRSTAISATAPLERNIPLLMGLVSVWNRNLLGYAVAGGDPLRPAPGRFPAYLQQLQHGEQRQERPARRRSRSSARPGRSSGASRAPTASTRSSSCCTRAPRLSPIDFLVAAKPTAADAHHHDLLLANCFAQGEALMRGRTPAEAEAITLQAGRERRRRPRGSRRTRPSRARGRPRRCSIASSTRARSAG